MPDSSQLSEIERLRLWFKFPVSKLSGDGAFVVLMISMSLWERYVYALINEEVGDSSKNAFEQRAADLLGIDKDTFNKFWGMFRVGLQHHLQPKIFEKNGIKYRWEISCDFPDCPALRKDADDLIVVIIDPWKWFNLVFDFWEKRPDLLSRLSEFPLAKVY
jgi:hypothetical protein